MKEAMHAQTVPEKSGTHEAGYPLFDELARLCLPEQHADNSYRTLAWINSICALFVLAALVGLKAPRLTIRPLQQVEEPIPIEVVDDKSIDPQGPPRPGPDKPRNDMANNVGLPPIPAIVPPERAHGGFELPGVTPVNSPEPGFTTNSPLPGPATEKPTVFNASNGGEGVFPPPRYPAVAQRNRYQGTVTIEIMVNESGKVARASVFKTSGFAVLDQAALDVVVSHWQFLPGPKRWLHWPCSFELR